MSPQPETTRILREEHVRILEVAGVLERIVEAEATESSLDLEALDDCVRFFRLFADACHHGKEEDLLFPELEARGLSASSGPIAVMLEEHRQARAHIQALAEGVEAAREGEQGASRRILDAAFSYVTLIRNHILKEDGVLFDMADRMVGPGGCQRLCARYARVCSGRFDGCTVQDLEELARKLGHRYPPS